MEIFYSIMLIFIFEAHGQDSCEWGKYGDKCSKDCPLNCFTNPDRNLKHCHKETGKCSEGCVPGWFDDLCDKTCSENCKGSSCIQQNGFCMDGCSEHYHGKFCNITAGSTATPPPRGYSIHTSPTPSPTTPFESTIEKTTNRAAILVVLILFVVLTVVVVVVVVIIRKRGEASRNSDDVSDILPCWRTTNAAIRGESIRVINAVTRVLPCWQITTTDDTATRTGENKPFIAHPSGEDLEPPKTDGDSSSVAVTLDAAIPQTVPKTDGDSSSVPVTLNAAIPQAAFNRGRDSSSSTVPLDPANSQPGPKLGDDDPCCFVDDVNLLSDTLEQKLTDIQCVILETESFKDVKVKLERHGHVTISGAPGEGKTYIALMLGAEYRKQGVELLLVEDVNKVQLSDYLDKGTDVCVIFDDIFKTVRSYMDLSKLEHFLYDLNAYLESRYERRYQRLQQETRGEQIMLNQPNIFVIFTADTNNLERAMAKLKGQQIFKSSSIVKLCCTNEEKKTMLLNYKRLYECSANVDVNKIIAYESTVVGFPLLCNLFSSCVGFQRNNESFFEKPVFYLKHQLQTNISSLDEKSAALILTLLCENQLNISQLEAEYSRQDSQLETECASSDSQLLKEDSSPFSHLTTESVNPDLETHLQAVTTLVKTSTRHGVAKAVRSLYGTLLTEGNTTTFSHSIIYDVCALVLFNIEPHFILKHCSIKFILEHVQAQLDDGISVNEHQLIIPFSEAYIGIIADRMAHAIVSGAFSMYIWHPIWKRREISDQLNHMITVPASLSEEAKHNILQYACFTGNKNILERLLPHCDINRSGLNGWTPVVFAVVSGQMECFEILVEREADMTLSDSNNNNLLHLACQHGHKSTVKHVKKALKKQLLPDLYLNQYINGRGVNDWTPVMCAVAFGKEDILDYLTKKGKTFERKKQNKVDFKLSDAHKNTVLHLACWYGNKSMVESLLPHTDINARGNNGQTPVMCALLSWRKEIVDLLVSKKADIALTDDDNNSLLHVASRVNGASLLLPLVPKFESNSRGKHGWTPLMKAAVHGHMDVFPLFLHTVDFTLKDDNNNNVLHLACHGGNVSIVKLLLPKFDINSRGSNGWTSVMFAAGSGVEGVFKLLVSQGADIRLRDDKNNSVLHLACFGGNISIVKYLLARPGTDINCLGSQGRTAIMITALAAKPALFKLLLSKKANITLTDDDYNTVLHHACQGGNYSIVNHLISKININSSGKHGWTPVMVAAWAGRKAVFDLLVKQNADLTLTDDYNDNVLHLACQGGSTAIVKCLVKLGDINRRGKNNSPQAMHAVRSVFSGNKGPREGNAPKEDIQSSTSPENDNAICVGGQSGKEATVNQESGYFDINVRGRDDQIPLMKAVCGGDMDVYIFLLSCGGDQTLVDKDGHTLLHLAAQHGQLHMVKYIIGYFDINTKDKAGLTPVMTSVASGNVAVFEYLRRRGADLSLVNNVGNDVLKLAREVGCRQILEQLEPAKKVKRFSGLKDTKVGKLFIQAKKNVHLHLEISSEVTGESSSSPNENSNDPDLKQTD